MADTKISALAAVTTVDDADEYAVARSGASKKITGANLKAGVAGDYKPSGTDVAVADGGTGASTASGARTNLGVAIGTDVPAQATFDDHSARHESGGADAIKLDDLAAPDDNTDLNASTSAHGLLKKLDNNAAHFLAGDGSWSTPAGSGSVATDAIWDTKGDLAVASAADTAAKLAVGSNNNLLVADSAQTLGVKWAKVGEAMILLADVTTNDVTSTAHGFAPKSPADATKFLNGATTPAYALVKDSDLSTTDITTNNVSTSKHGFAPKVPNDATKYLDGTGAYSVPSGGAAGALTLLSTTTLGANGTFDVSTISGSYNDLILVLIARGARTAFTEDVQLRFNNDSGSSNYQREQVTGAGATASASQSGLASSIATTSGAITAASGTGNAFGVWECVVYGYASTTWQKSVIFDAFEDCDAGTGSQIVVRGGGQWLSTAAITRVQIQGLNTANLVTGSQLRIYGRL